MLDSLKPGGEWKNTVYILAGWGAFKGKNECSYQVVRQERRQYGSLALENCWFIRSKGIHSQIDKWLLRVLSGKGKALGESYLDFYFHPAYGFTEMNYRFYDGTKISFLLTGVEGDMK